METTAHRSTEDFAPVARPGSAAATFLPPTASGRAVLAQAVALAFAIRGDVNAVRAHDLDMTAVLLAR